MLCKCGGSSFKIIDVEREKRWSYEKKAWVYDPVTDARRARCKKCGKVYITKTVYDGIEEYDENSNRLIIKKFEPRKSDQTRLF